MPLIDSMNSAASGPSLSSQKDPQALSGDEGGLAVSSAPKRALHVIFGGHFRRS